MLEPLLRNQNASSKQKRWTSALIAIALFALVFCVVASIINLYLLSKTADRVDRTQTKNKELSAIVYGTLFICHCLTLQAVPSNANMESKIDTALAYATNII